jgi:transcriptional regulator GlxA family with amidase domain
MCGKPSAPPVDPQPTPTATHGVVRGHVVVAIDVLRDRLAEPWTLDALAEEVQLSRSQLVRSFDATVGLSPMATYAQLRCHCGIWALLHRHVCQSRQFAGSTDPRLH